MSTITTINATDKPRLSREVINTNFANLNASKAETSDVVLLAGDYANPSWITLLSWAKITGAPATYAPSAHTHPFSEITGSIANAQVPASAVTQHQTALTITQSQVTSLTTDLAGKVAGAPALTTAGAVPFVSSAGTLGQDGTTLMVDSTNHRVGVGTASPTSQLHVGSSAVRGTLIVEGSSADIPYIQIKDGKTGGKAWTLYSGLNNVGDFSLYDVTGVTTALTVKQSTNAFGFGKGNTAPTGTASFLDRTAITGASDVLVGTDGTNTSATSSRLVVRLGQDQSTVKPLDVQSNAGSSLAYVAADGSFTAQGLTSPSLTNAGTLALSATGANVITLSANGSERARIDASGRLLLGSSTNRNGLLQLTGDTTANGETGSIKLVSGTTATYQHYIGVTSAGVGYWQNVNSGINYALPISLQPIGGNLLVGTTTDDGASKLQVAGVIRQTNNTGFVSARTDSGNAYVGILNSSNQVAIGYNSDAVVLMGGTQRIVTLTNTGTLTHYNPTAVTGSTSLVIRAGAGQSTNILFQLQDNSANVFMKAYSNGSMYFQAPGVASSEAYMLPGSGVFEFGGNTGVALKLTANAQERLRLNATGIAFFGGTPVARQTATADAASILALLQAYGLSN